DGSSSSGGNSDSGLGGADDDGGAVLQPGAGPGRYVHGRWSFDVLANWQVAPQRSWGFDLALHVHGREGYPVPYHVPVVAGDRIRQVQAGDSDDFRLDDVVTVNLRLAKEVRLGRSSLVVSLDTFNLLNDTSVFERDTRLDTPQAGLVRETVSPRVVQLGFRVSWK
ncbi:MAG: hypothetical protein MI919_30760, partial [Holophagales bacterium]|nr:hypothetical protein [Holophagales bacterium]